MSKADTLEPPQGFGGRFLVQRAYPRAAVNWTAKWTNRWGVVCSGEVRDVSVRGLFLRSTEALNAILREGSWVRLSVALPNGEILPLGGEVRWGGDHTRHIHCGNVWI